MDANVLLIVVLVAVIVGLVAWIYLQRTKSQNLRRRFGPEYQDAVRYHGDRAKAERELEQRAKRVQVLDIHPLTSEDRERFASAWRENQAHFVDNPAESIQEADDLVCRVMKARGYPMEDFNLRAADLSVDYPHVIRNYRAAHDIAVRHERGEASTEDLRQALIYYRELFAELLETPQPLGRQEVHR